MKLFVRSIVCGKNTQSNRSIEPLDLSDYKYAEIYKTEVSFDKNTSALFNNVNSDQTINGISIKKGFYTLQELMSVINTQGVLISLITTEENAYHCKLSSQVDFSNARELQEILGFDNVIASGVSNHPVDITRGLNVLQIYSSIVNSDTDTPICTIKIDDPTKDFHDCLYTNCPIVCTPINYIDIVFRDIHGEVVSLNAENINVTLFIRAYNEMELIGDQPLVERAFNITTGIDKLEGGKFTKQLDNSMCLTDGKVVNANFLLDGKINNLSTEQVIELDDVSYTIPAGCYELQELLARLNALSSAVFSYVSSGEDCYKLTISGCEKLSCSDELANMLGLEMVSKGEEVETVRYQLTESANVFIYKNSNASYIIPIATGIYTEKVFFKKLEDAIRPYQSDISITESDYFWSLNHGLIFPADGNYASRSLEHYYWSSAINHRKEGDNSIIPKVGCFYFDEEVNFNLLNQRVYWYFERRDMQKKNLSIEYCDSSGNVIETTVFDLSTIPNGVYGTHDFIKKFYNESGICNRYTDNYTYRSHGFFSRNNNPNFKGNIRFYGSPGFIEAFHLPSTFENRTYFEMYLTNGDYKTHEPVLSGETLTCTFEEHPDEPIVYSISSTNTEGVPIMILFSELRRRVNAKIAEWYNISSSNEFLNYNCPMFMWICPNRTIKSKNLKYKFGGTLIEKGWLTGLHTEYNNAECVARLTGGPTTHRINIGYTNMEGLQTGLQNLLNDREYGKELQPSMTWGTSYGTITSSNPNALTSITISNFNVVNYESSVRKREWCERTEFYSPSADIEVTADNYQVIISKPSGEDQIINIPLGWYTKESLFEKFNSYLEHPFTRKETYWVLDYCPNKLDYNLEIDFLMMSSEVRVYYPNNKVIESFMLKGSYPVNITNGFNLVNVFTNIIETSANTDNYLTSFVIDRTTGKNVSAAGVKHNYANSSKPINRVIAESNINSIEYYFSREDGNPFNINGKINCTLEIVE